LPPEDPEAPDEPEDPEDPPESFDPESLDADVDPESFAPPPPVPPEDSFALDGAGSPDEDFASVRESVR
jgi:hypothetical protein